jgi:hypothetical protein
VYAMVVHVGLLVAGVDFHQVLHGTCCSGHYFVLI